MVVGLVVQREQPDRGGIDRVADHVPEPGHRVGMTEAHRHLEHLLGHLDQPFHARAPSGEDDAAGNSVQAGAADVVPHEAEQLFAARLHHLREGPARQAPGRTIAKRGHLDRLVLGGAGSPRAAVLDLDLLGVRNRGSEGRGRCRS